jgi:hypothetical protein
MFKDLLMRKMLKSQGVPEGQIDQLLTIVNKNPDLFKKIAEEVQARVAKGEDQMSASMAVMKNYQDELKKLV